MRVAVTGGRDFNDVVRIGSVLSRVHRERGITLLIHGEARGADTHAGNWAWLMGIPVLEFDAAGPIRNGQMIEEVQPDPAGRFLIGSGTRNNMLLQARMTYLEIIQG